MTQLLIDHATLEQLVAALNEVDQHVDLKRYDTAPNEVLFDVVMAALTAGRTALAQQELPQKERPDFMAGYDAGMADAKRMAQQGEHVAWAIYDKRGGSKSLHWAEQHTDGNAEMYNAVPLYKAAPAPVPQAQPAQASGRTNPGDETGGAVERFGWQTFLGKSPEIVPATNGSFVWYSDYLKLWQSAQQAATKNCPQPEICGSKECEFCRDTAAPAPQAQQVEPVAQARLGMKDGLAMALSVVELYGMKGDVIYREIAKLRDGIAAAPAPQPAQGVPETNFGNMPVKFLVNGTRFKMSFFQNEDEEGNYTDGTHVMCFDGYEKVLDGRWVALVAAENDCHLQSTQPLRDLTDEEILSLEKQTPAMNDAGEEWIYFARAGLKKARE